MNTNGLESIAFSQLCHEVSNERRRAIAKHGDHSYTPSFVAADYGVLSADDAKAQTDTRFAAGHGSWADILVEEVAEALEEIHDYDALRVELIQVAQVAMSWVIALDESKSRTVYSGYVSISGEVALDREF